MILVFLLAVCQAAPFHDTPTSLFMQGARGTDSWTRDASPPTHRDPIILVPGLVCSLIEAKLDHVVSPGKLCRNSEDWHVLWIDLALASLEPKCWAYELELGYDQSTSTYFNTKGVSTRLRHSRSGLDGVRCLDPTICKTSSVFGKLEDYLTKELGYIPGKDLFGAPYDWRAGFEAYDEYFQELKTQTEYVSAMNDGAKVHYISISMGGPYMVYFFNNFVDQQWKDQFVNSHISMSGVFSGAPVILYFMLSPAKWSTPLIPSAACRNMTRTFGSALWLMPPQNKHWMDIPLITSENGYSFSPRNYDDLLQPNVTCPQVTRSIWDNLKKNKLWYPRAPGVPMHVAYGFAPNVTQVAYHYKTWPPGDDLPISQTMADGDNTVDMYSLRGIVEEWAEVQKEPIEFKQFDGLTHDNLLWKRESWEYIRSIVTKD